MTKEGLLEVDLSSGGAAAMRESADCITNAVLEEAERLAIIRGKIEQCSPVILRRDIEEAILKVG